MRGEEMGNEREDDGVRGEEERWKEWTTAAGGRGREEEMEGLDNRGTEERRGRGEKEMERKEEKEKCSW